MASHNSAALIATPRTANRVPPHAYFMVSAVFHYLGPSMAVLLFAYVTPPGVAWLRIASAGLVFALWRRPWRFLAKLSRADQGILVLLGLVLAAMNMVFYEAITRLPLATVGAIEFLGPVMVAAVGVRSGRNLAALVLAVAGAYVLTEVRLAGNVSGYAFAFANCGLFVLYILLGHRIASSNGGASGIDRLGGAMLIASVAALPFGFAAALPAFADPNLLAAAVGVGISSSVIPYICDQLAMRRLPRPTFALLLSLLPATATVIGLVVLHQTPGPAELLGILLVITGVALHRANAQRAQEN